MMRTHERNASSPPPQVVRKRKREEEKQEVGQEVTKPEKKRLVESAALVSDLHQQPSTPAGKRIASRRKIEAAQTAELRKLKPYLERRYFVNAAVLPECRPRPPGFAAPKTSSAGETLPDQPVTIHTLSVPEYQSLYHSVVDPKLVTSTGKPHPYCMALGRLIKQHLWDKLRCPSMMEEEQWTSMVPMVRSVVDAHPRASARRAIVVKKSRSGRFMGIECLVYWDVWMLSPYHPRKSLRS
ncbi:hypothetical protein QTP70_000642 [Hemibagrus guttatus]|uniref:Uncharacterized protein n=1 Tax=Hemibagrus guttatus TaxID=175788 RepID=A0AAE0QCR4_9TELE|nr:hypothetical protein QTP70_000642 [Hemibagrus guttatus]